MKYLFFSLIACLLMMPITNGQTLVSPFRKVGDTPQDAKPKSAEIEEINQLNASVVELYREGKYKEALPRAKRSLELSEKLFGAEHQSTIPALANVAELHFVLKHYQDAEPLYRRLLLITNKAVGPDHQNSLSYLKRLAFLRYLRKDYPESELLNQRVLSISEKVFGVTSIEIIGPLENLAILYTAQGDVKKTNKAYKQLVETVEALPEKDFSRLEERIAGYGCLKNKLRAIDNLYNGNPPPEEPFKGQALSLGIPRYPAQAKQAGVQGQVPVRIVVDEEGRVSHACAMTGPRVLAAPAEEAAFASRFTPTIVKGKPVKVTGIVTFNFTL